MTPAFATQMPALRSSRGFVVKVGHEELMSSMTRYASKCDVLTRRRRYLAGFVSQAFFHSASLWEPNLLSGGGSLTLQIPVSQKTANNFWCHTSIAPRHCIIMLTTFSAVFTDSQTPAQVSVKNTFLWGEPFPCKPGAETAPQPLICHSESWSSHMLFSFQGSVSS